MTLAVGRRKGVRREVKKVGRTGKRTKRIGGRKKVKGRKTKAIGRGGKKKLKKGQVLGTRKESWIIQRA